MALDAVERPAALVPPSWRARSLGIGEGGDADIIAHCDNLALMESLPGGLCQLLYLDPPFATQKARKGPKGAYRDTFSGGADAYLSFLEPRLWHARRLLSDDGSLFVHLDFRAVHAVKLLLDRIFGARRFVNEIIWCYTLGGRSLRAFGRKHDTVLFYAKTGRYTFHPRDVRIERRPGSHMKVVRDAHGGLVQVKADRRTGRIYKYPLVEGKIPEDWWSDIETLNRSAAERVGYPTQKPERLIERIVAAASDPGRCVADFFLGSGTTAAVARRLGRRFIGADSSGQAIDVSVARVAKLAAALGPGGHDLLLLSPPA